MIKLRHHGDVLLTTPVFQILKNRAPHLEIDALVYGDTVPILEGHPAINRVHGIDREWKRRGLHRQIYHETGLYRTLNERKYDLIIHLTEHNRGAWLVKLLRPRYSVAESRSGIYWNRCFTHTFAVQYQRPRHTVEKNLDALRRIGIQPDAHERRLIMQPKAATQERVAALMAEHSLTAKKFIHLHPTSRWLFKAWPESEVAKLINELHTRGETVVVTAAPSQRERAMVARILEGVKTPVINLTGQLTLPEMAALTAQAKVFLGVDSAPMHIAASQQTPAVALFGPSDEMLWGPWQSPHRVVTSLLPEHRCRPCGLDGCGGGKVSDCLTRIPAQQVLNAMDDLLTEMQAIHSSRVINIATANAISN